MMKEVQNNMWSLMAKYMVNEASSEERIVMNRLLQESEELKDIYNKLCPYYQINEKFNLNDPAEAFKKLNAKIQNIASLK